jgi:hypothetical protein
MTDTKCNGWTNYATWRVNLEIVDEYVSSILGEQTFSDVAELRDHLEEMVDDVLTNYGEIKDGLALEYARAFVADVDFHEIAEANKDELVRADTEEEDES